MIKIIMKYNFIKEIVTGAPNDTQHQKKDRGDLICLPVRPHEITSCKDLPSPLTSTSHSWIVDGIHDLV